jgi:hypothetical protein
MATSYLLNCFRKFRRRGSEPARGSNGEGDDWEGKVWKQTLLAHLHFIECDGKPVGHTWLALHFIAAVPMSS